MIKLKFLNKFELIWIVHYYSGTYRETRSF